MLLSVYWTYKISLIDELISSNDKCDTRWYLLIKIAGFDKT